VILAKVIASLGIEERRTALPVSHAILVTTLPLVTNLQLVAEISLGPVIRPCVSFDRITFHISPRTWLVLKNMMEVATLTALFTNKLLRRTA
jgi:hypothetical protein